MGERKEGEENGPITIPCPSSISCLFAIEV